MEQSTEELETLAGIGPRMANDLVDLGFRKPEDLRDQNPEKMYEDLCELRGAKVDRCALYHFRCAVYSASTDAPDRKLLKWWKWKDAPHEQAHAANNRRAAGE